MPAQTNRRELLRKAAASAAVVGLPIAASAADAKKRPAAAIDKLLKARRDVARREFDQRLRQLRNRTGRADEAALDCARRLLTAELELCDTNAQKVAALEEHLKRAQEITRVAEAYAKAGQGREVDALSAAYARLEAEIWLEKAKAE